MPHNDIEPAFAVEIAHRAGSTLVSFSGELDIASAGDMRESLERSDVAGASTVQVDLAEVTFLDTTGLGVLIAACKRVHGTKRDLLCDLRGGHRSARARSVGAHRLLASCGGSVAAQA